MRDPVVEELRALIAEGDRVLVETVNRRLELVARLWRHKREAGLPVFDRERERALLERLAAANSGPLSDEGVRDLVRAVLDLTKRELERTED